ncbi:MAG TPA: hypothetical protein VL981_14920 [Candidatus Methylacidiphilales bacterium]|nr:hypothetical protein [Candidatus Methylacidiphilales bacterium]
MAEVIQSKNSFTCLATLSPHHEFMSRTLAGAVVRFFSLFAFVCIPALASEQNLAGHYKIMAKLDTLICNDATLTNVTISDIAQLLTRESRKSDPDRQGINFVPEMNPGDYYYKVTLHLQKGTFWQVLKHMECPIFFTAGDSTVSIENFSGDGMFSETFLIPDGFFNLNPDQTSQISCNVMPQLKTMGILFPPGASATYQPSLKKLSVVVVPGVV